LDRRSFFRQGLRKASEIAVKEVEAHIKRKIRWIRPPYALAELEFLLTCTRCGDCISACPHQVIFPLPASVGTQIAGTPALDLLNKACHLCPEWHCLKVCQPRALRLPQTEHENDKSFENQSDTSNIAVKNKVEIIPIPLPRLALSKLDESRCLPYKGPECGACRGVCPVEGAMVWNMEKPRIIKELCVGCALCRVACIVEPKAIAILNPNQHIDDC